MNYPRISFLVSTFNMAPHVEAMLDSVLQACMPGDELFIVDDGSRDGTDLACERWAKVHFPSTKLHRQANQGVCSSRETALSIASNDYLLFLDGDDVLEPSTIQKARSIASKFQPDIIEFDFLYWTPDSPGTQLRPSQAKSHEPDKLTQDRDYILAATLKDRAWALWGRLLHRRLFPPRGTVFFPLELSIDDLPSTPRLAARARSLYYVAHPIIRYRMTANSLSKQRSARHCLDIAKSTKVVLDNIGPNLPSYFAQQALNVWVAQTFYESLRMASQSPQCGSALFQSIFQSVVKDNDLSAQSLAFCLKETGNALDSKIARELLRFDRTPRIQGMLRVLKSRLRSRAS